MLYIFWISAWQYIRPDNKRGEKPSQLWKRIFRFILFSNRKVVIGFQIFSALGSVIFIMLQKFTLAPAPTAQDRQQGVGEWCSLNNKRDNEWAFGQACAMLLLLIPIYAGMEAFCGKSLYPFYYNKERKIQDLNRTIDPEETKETVETDLEGQNANTQQPRQTYDSLVTELGVEMFDLKRRRSSVF
jgi:hypothetical protein